MVQISKERSDIVSDSTQESIRRRHLERKRRRIAEMKRRRIITISLLILIVLSIIIFFTPIFKVRKIEIVGNVRVEATEIQSKLEPCMGKNIFRFRTKKPINNIKTIAYIDTVSIKKSPIKSKIIVRVTECEPAAYIEAGEKNIILDRNMKVLEIVEKVDLEIPVIRDVTASGVNLGAVVSLQNESTLNAVKTCIGEMTDEGILSGVKYISFKEIGNITFNYQDRLDVKCGRIDDFEKKIKIFNQAINSPKLTEKSRGTIDLSTTGQAVYTP